MTVERPEFDEAIKRIEAEDTRQNHRLSTLEDTVRQINDLTLNIGKIATNVETLTKEMSNQGKRLEFSESRDGEMWKSIVKYAVFLSRIQEVRSSILRISTKKALEMHNFRCLFLYVQIF